MTFELILALVHMLGFWITVGLLIRERARANDNAQRLLGFRLAVDSHWRTEHPDWGLPDWDGKERS